MNYRETRNGYLNCEKRIYDGVGKYGIPEILPEHVDIGNPDVIGFNYAIGERKPGDKILHFFVDDYQFERVWLNPVKYINLFRRFKAVCAPDFSIYTDFPAACSIFNHYRKHWLARYWQEHGIRVIPTICWGDDDSFDWCLDGEPVGGVVATSCIGCFKSKERTEEYWKCFTRAMKEVKPTKILLLCGGVEVEVPDVSAEVIKVSASTIKRLDDMKKREKGDEEEWENSRIRFKITKQRMTS